MKYCGEPCSSLETGMNQVSQLVSEGYSKSIISQSVEMMLTYQPAGSMTDPSEDSSLTVANSQCPSCKVILRFSRQHHCPYCGYFLDKSRRSSLNRTLLSRQRRSSGLWEDLLLLICQLCPTSRIVTMSLVTCWSQAWEEWLWDRLELISTLIVILYDFLLFIGWDNPEDGVDRKSKPLRLNGSTVTLSSLNLERDGVHLSSG